MARTLTNKELAQRAAANTVHGGAGAVERLADGRPFVGLAAEAERSVTADLPLLGPSGMIERGARRLEAAALLYWNALCKAADDGDLDKLDHYVARFGWLQGVASRCWARVATGDGGALEAERERIKRMMEDDR